MKRTAILVGFVFACGVLVHGDGIILDFETLDGWQDVKFISTRRESRFSVDRLDGEHVLEIMSEDAISGIVYETVIELTETPIIEWRWRIADWPD